MLTASDKFKANLRTSHRPMVRCAVYLPDDAGDYQFNGYLGVSSGSLSIDYRRNIRRQVTGLQIAPISPEAETTFITNPNSSDFLESLATASAEIDVEWGLRFPDRTEEWVTVARLRMEEGNSRVTGAPVSLTSVFDLGCRVADFTLITPYAPFTTGGTKLTYIEAIQDLVNTAYPAGHSPTWTIDGSLDSTSKPPDNTAFTGDRWTAIQALAKAINATVGATASGEWAITSAVTGTTSVWTVNTGTDGVLVDGENAFSRREQYNAIPVRWESPTGGGGLAYIVDSDPTSPTYYDGPFGRKPRSEETVATITTSDQATAYATTLLNQYKGLTRSVSLTSIHNPLLEPNDVIDLEQEDGTFEQHIIDSITLPLDGGTMTLETRVLRA